ncbi:hypothetical protein KCH_05590 [Kitasatospora cheerisanensis KCTC 2395]|uniref:Uncharacterized protein n=2 Tax=Kitasatospora cheerisanensis TaxID=81942 RepID=A0A066Z1I8_9ACTN|nr:hypothetical protein KCH_05590 [Kitasatospora cheerisanensis KCTC 2395]
MMTVLATDTGRDDAGPAPDPAETGRQLRELAALAPEPRRDAVAELAEAEGQDLLGAALAWAVAQEDPWTAGADAGVLAAVLEAMAGGIVAAVGVGNKVNRRAKLLLEAWAQLLRAVECDAAGNRAEAHRRFLLARQYGESAGEWRCAVLAALGTAVCGSAAHTARAEELVPHLEPAVAELERFLGRELPELREGLWLRYEAFELVAAAADAERPEQVVELTAPWLERRAPGALVELAAAWRRELWRLLEEGAADRAVLRAEWGDRLVARADPGSPFRYWLAECFAQAGDWDRTAAVVERLRAEHPDDGPGLLRRLARAHGHAGRRRTAIDLLRSGLSDPPTAAEEEVLRTLVLMLMEEDSPEAARWEAELVRLAGTGVRELASAMPRPAPNRSAPSPGSRTGG